MMQALQIEFTLLNMHIPSSPMHIDDLVSAAAVKQALSKIKQVPPDFNYQDITEQLPIQKCIKENDWVYKASALHFESVTGKFMSPVTRRINIVNFANDRASGVLFARQNKLNLNSGAQKSSIDLLQKAAHVKVTAWCIGDLNAVQQLLQTLTHIGKKHTRGSGQILEFKITEVESTRKLWKNRNFPFSMQSEINDNHQLCADIGIRPPYWKNKRKTGFAIPNFFKI